jgi:hypothetical protein
MDLKKLHSQAIGEFREKKKKVIESTGSAVRDRAILGKTSAPKMGVLIRSLAFDVIRQKVPKAPLVCKNICALAEATSACDGIWQLRRAHEIGPESDEAYYDCQPKTLFISNVCPYLCLHNDHRDPHI